MKYSVNYGESPSSIARKHGVSVSSLIGANPGKQVVAVAGQHTWQSLGVGEQIELPVGVGYLGDPVSDAINALLAAGGPCVQANAPLVCLVQGALGLTQDGKYGDGTSAAAKRFVPNAPKGCSPAPLWWGKKGENKCGGAMPVLPLPISLPPMVIPGLPPTALPIPVASPVPSLPPVAAAVQALTSIDPCNQANAPLICAAQAALGLTADGKYGNDTAAKVRQFVPSARPGCSPAPLWWGTKGSNKCGGAIPSLPSLPSPSQPVVIPNPIPGQPPISLPSLPSQPIVLPSPIPGQPPVVIPPVSAPVVIPSPVPGQPPVVIPAPITAGLPPAAGGQPIVTAPVEKKISTGAIIAGSVAAVAVIGLLVVASGKKSTTKTTRTTTVRRAPAKRKSSPKKKSSRRKKR